MELVFVYGTLRPGGAAAEKMSNCKWVGSARVRGKLYQIQWYPGLVLGGEGWVIGDLFEVPKEEMDQLDAYEACRSSDPEPHEYVRKKAIARDDLGTKYEVWTWEYIQPVSSEKIISQGDWLMLDDV